jgi:hypothetical protein
LSSSCTIKVLGHAYTFYQDNIIIARFFCAQSREYKCDAPYSFGIKIVSLLLEQLSFSRLWRNIIDNINNKNAIEAFDQHQFERHPPPSTLIMRILGFAIVNIIGFDLQAILGDIAIDVTLSRFYIHATIWLKVLQDEWSWILTLGILNSSTNWDGFIIRNETLHKFYESQV